MINIELNNYGLFLLSINGTSLIEQIEDKTRDSLVFDFINISNITYAKDNASFT